MTNSIESVRAAAYVNLFIAIKEQAEKDFKLYIFEKYWLGEGSPINWNLFRRQVYKDDTKQLYYKQGV